MKASKDRAPTQTAGQVQELQGREWSVAPRSGKGCCTWASVFPVLLHMATLLCGVELPAQETLVPQGAVWRYWDAGTVPDAEWRALAYDDATWKSGSRPERGIHAASTAEFTRAAGALLLRCGIA